ncbi:MAG: hypothetical protein ACLGHN_07785 [Bacteriovoracia bacterium]
MRLTLTVIFMLLLSVACNNKNGQDKGSEQVTTDTMESTETAEGHDKEHTHVSGEEVDHEHAEEHHGDHDHKAHHPEHAE